MFVMFMQVKSCLMQPFFVNYVFDVRGKFFLLFPLKEKVGEK